MRSKYTDHLIFMYFSAPKREWILKMAQFYDLGWHFDVDKPDHVELVKHKAMESIREYEFVTRSMSRLIDIMKLAEAYDDWNISITSIKKYGQEE